MERQHSKFDENQTGKFNYYSHVLGDNNFKKYSNYSNNDVKDRYQMGDGKYRTRRSAALPEHPQDKAGDNIGLQLPTSGQRAVKNLSPSQFQAYKYPDDADLMATTNFSKKNYSRNYAEKHCNARTTFVNENQKEAKEDLVKQSNPYDSIEPFSFEQVDELIRKKILTEKKSKNLDTEGKEVECNQSNEHLSTDNLVGLTNQKFVDTNRQSHSPLAWKEQYFRTPSHPITQTKTCTSPNNNTIKTCPNSRSNAEKVFTNATTQMENIVRHPSKKNLTTLKVKYNNETFKNSDQEYKYLSEQEKEAAVPPITQSSATEDTSAATLLSKRDVFRSKSTSHSHSDPRRRSIPRPSSRKYGEDRLRKSAELSESKSVEKSTQQLKHSNVDVKDLQKVSRLTVNSKGKSSSSSLKPVHMDTVLKMFTEIRNYHLQNITDEVVRLRDLEVLPQKLSDHTSL